MLEKTTPDPSRAGGLDNSALDDSTAMVSCTAERYRGPGGSIVVLRVAGEIDRVTLPVLHAALDAGLDGALDRAARHFLVDVAGVTFCCVRGFVLLADTATAATTAGTGYGISGLPGHLQRYARLLWTDRAPIRCYRNAAVAVTALRAEQAPEAPEHLG